VSLRDKIHEAGVVGAGGAGFPTDTKLNCKVEYFIINGLECEPLLQSDKYIMRNKSDEIIKAAQEIGKSVEASKIVMALKKEYEREIEALKASIDKLNSNVTLYLSDVFYPAGDEQTLVYEVTGKTIPPAGIPLNVGAVVSNVTTVFNIYEAMEDKPVIYKFVTVIGEVKTPSIIKVPIGTSVLECIESCGGTRNEDYGVIIGGPMMGKRVLKKDLENKFITKTDGGIMVLPSEHYLLNREKTTIEHMKKQAKSACIQCHYCTDMCPRHLIGHPIHPDKIMRNVAFGVENEEALKETLICCECGVCEMYACPMGLSPKRINVYFKNELRKKGVKWVNNKEKFEASSIRDYRKIPTNRLAWRLHLDEYVNQTLKEGEEIIPSKVEIPLKQNIGAAAEPIVSLGEKVFKGQKIGEVKEGNMGANIHASIDGVIADIKDGRIVIKLMKPEVIV
jgi:Na+-translocating ferredoxin:NAD+ oxidoreductase RnfC subunit